MKTIDCEVAKVFDRDMSKTHQGFTIRPLEKTDENVNFFKSFAKSKWSEKFESISCNIFHNGKPNPDWLVEQAQVELDIINNDGYLNIDIASVKVLKLPEKELEDLDDDDFNAEKLEEEAVKDLENKSNVTNLKPKAVKDNIDSKKLSKIQELTDNYGDVFKVVNSHPNLVSLPLEEKTKITTHINITLSQQGY